MAVLNLFKRNKIDFNSIESINRIPIPKYQPLRGLESPVDNIEYVLQRKATEHKKNGRMDLAVACLRKSNELMDHSNFHYAEKDYIRLVKYLRLAGLDAEADIEEHKIYQMHPEFLDKRISNLNRINEALERNKKWGNDLVCIRTNPQCPVCKKYNQKIFSISGKSKKYPPLPQEITRDGGFCRNCTLGITSFFDGISTTPKQRRK